VQRHTALAVATVAALSLIPSALSAAPPKADYAAAAWSILPPGEGGTVSSRHATDQLVRYEQIAERGANVTPRDLRRFFKPARLARVERPESRERPRPGVTIVRDRFGVAHVTGATEDDVAFGAGWVTAADRGQLLRLLRGPGRLAALDVPGVDLLALAFSGKTFVPSDDTEAYLSNQLDALRAQGEDGRRVLAMARAYTTGINRWFALKGVPIEQFTVRDVVAATALLGALFGAGGGREITNAMFLDALEERLGTVDARSVFADLRWANDPEAPVTVDRSYPYGPPAASTDGSVVVDDGSFTGLLPGQPEAGSSALLVAGNRSATGHPLLVAGPQVGFFFPQLLLEIELRGAGFATRGALFPGIPFVFVGRGPDFAWSATSSSADGTDLFVETLCGDDRRYLYRDQCRPMRRSVVGTLSAAGVPDETVEYLETAHGPVVGYATVGGRRVAIAAQRSTRGREVLSTRALYRLNSARVTSARTFLEAMGSVELAFNWFYADDRDIAFFSSGRLPMRSVATDPGLPTLGTGNYDWRGSLSVSDHPQAVNPPSGVIVNWNNKPARGFGPSDSDFSHGPVHRVQLLVREISRRRTHTLASVTAALNVAATEDLRVARVWPAVKAVLDTGPAPTARAQAASSLVTAWRLAGGSRLDRDADGLIDAPGAAILDAAWPALADAVLSPVLGPLVDRLAAIHPRSDDAGPEGSAYLDGWYGYVEKDLRTLLGRSVRGQLSRRYCGAGLLVACRESLWAAIDDAARRLESEQGPAPASWRVDATRERIRFLPGTLADTMQWTNRPTFQQLMTFADHRPR
jgi:acyl-homoserine lactone acylase PvdQ